MTEHEEETSTRPPPGKGKGGPGFGFQCKLTSSRVLVDGLSALHFGKKDQFASFTVNNVGLRVSVQNVAKTMHAVMYIKANVFDDFDPPVQEQSRHEEDDGEPEVSSSHHLVHVTFCLTSLGADSFFRQFGKFVGVPSSFWIKCGGHDNRRAKIPRNDGVRLQIPVVPFLLLFYILHVHICAETF
eukprot:gb/GECG01001161.1/.p1 GENE.gb/GECG01001161.1/~~gb/GECG01001161.1/.p1  ORF type:complete len:185 (+),score=19.59 gb/GECG01001161.1/:1-555(+)